ncbi:hypothetical protein V0R50_07120 [Pseudomonas sp. 148P]|uniref:Uncharacterized protein n=1 Tax=Pseudomonas ulcerans TaxID=3115852 RepID=A0ABU7HN83_9PSED|nr:MULTISPECIES: hypothetical protein [unclassified Pseudomonas]MEE1922511.1 hypothetical protein [Pseudomonas sp. 147P]MEE1932985.1 hypothetical protein [Pseudomonas sp. 148P]
MRTWLRAVEDFTHLACVTIVREALRETGQDFPLELRISWIPEWMPGDLVSASTWPDVDKC